MADPLSAFAVACNILQIVEVGAKILTKAAEYHDAADGAPADHVRLHEVAESLKTLNIELAAKLPDTAHSAALPAAKELIAANERCLRLSDDFVELMNSLKIDGKPSMLQSLRMAIRSARYQDRVKSMRNSLSAARDNLNIALLVYLQQSGSSMHHDVLQTNRDTERRIISTVTASASSVKEDVEILVKQMENMSIKSLESVFAEFRSSHREFLNQLTQALKKSLESTQAGDTASGLEPNLQQDLSIRQKVMDGLYFPQIFDRRDAITPAHQETFEWIFRTEDRPQARWDSFSKWVGSDTNDGKIYWIHGKPGSGKSTLMRFLDERLDNQVDLLRRASNKEFQKVFCYLWGPGTPLQKSLAGLVRSILFQLLQHTADRIAQIIPRRVWEAAKIIRQGNMEWRIIEMIETVYQYVSSGGVGVFVLIDGLDEFEGTDDQQEQLLHFLLTLAKYPNVKLCVSSRPLNIFKDAFDGMPQLRVQDLTRDDIAHYINTQFSGNARFNQLQRQDPGFAGVLASTIISKADGVFLWVKLVVRELLKSARDGDDLEELFSQLESLPNDLGIYFQTLMDSIEARHRREASIMLQIALHQERRFETLFDLCLLDVSFIPDHERQVRTSYGIPGHSFKFSSREALYLRLESAIRRLNSRCLGLVECQFQPGVAETVHLQRRHGPGSDIPAADNGDASSVIASLIKWAASDGVDGAMKDVQTVELARIYNFKVNFLHRSFRDFLVTPEVQKSLHEYSGGPFNATAFLVYARLAQLMAIDMNKEQRTMAFGLASYIVCALSTPEIKHTRMCEEVARQLEPIVDKLAALLFEDEMVVSYWYLNRSLETYDDEESTFLTVAIDFDLVAYVVANMTPAAIQEKHGRPILDYILRGRFRSLMRNYKSFTIANTIPNVELVEVALTRGADPNQPCEGRSVWALFLQSVCEARLSPFYEIDEKFGGEAFAAREQCIQKTMVTAVWTMLRHGAHVVLPAGWLKPAAASLAEMKLRDREEFRLTSDLDVGDFLALLGPYYTHAQDELQECVALARSMA
ncbi:hypothetical protein HJFPF1_09731 [Paramyrothecium foliicola]|nr:hypothetical protein HJFPF1_09731 [Paramyrothecium foliicola]